MKHLNIPENSMRFSNTCYCNQQQQKSTMTFEFFQAEWRPLISSSIWPENFMEQQQTMGQNPKWKSISMLLFKRSHSVSERFYISIFPSFLPSDPKPQFQNLHNQQLCQFISDWLLRLDTRILIKILEIQYENSVVNYFLKIILIKILKNFMVI